MRGACAAGFVLLAALVSLIGCRHDPQPGEPLPADTALPSLPPVPYAVRFPNGLPAEVASLLPQASESARRTDRPPTSVLALRQRARDDIPRLEQALRSLGYYEPRIDFRIEEAASAPPPQGIVARIEEVAEGPRTALIFEIEPGPLYRFGELRVSLDDNSDGYKAPSLADLGLVRDAAAKAQVVLDAEQALLKSAREQGFALAALGRSDAVVDHNTRRMDVALNLRPGRRASFGKVTFTGAEGIDTVYLRGRVPLQAGEPYHPEPLEEGRRNLFDTDLFSTVILRPADTLTPEGRLDVTYDLTQRPHRSIGASLDYRTDEGPGIGLFWEHRNLLSGGERLRADLEARTIRQQASLSFTRPDFLALHQNLLANTALKQETSDAFDSTSLGAGLGLEQEFTEEFKASIGITYRYAKIQDRDEPEEEFGLVSLPVTINWNFADDILNPTRGGTLVASTAPYHDTLGFGRNFLKSRLTHTRYVKVLSAPEIVLALRGSIGSILGVETEEIPADERFYAGGGGSVRGIGYQLAGPLDEDDDPQGGRSVLEGSVELRTRLRNNLGGVLFLDAGSVFDRSLPGLDEELLFGIGPGLRYFTPIGPLRFDLGFPINPREGIDDTFQLYLSIGQAF